MLECHLDDLFRHKTERFQSKAGQAGRYSGEDGVAIRKRAAARIVQRKRVRRSHLPRIDKGQLSDSWGCESLGKEGDQKPSIGWR